MQSKNLTISVLLILCFMFLLPPLSPARTPQEVAQIALGSTVLVTITDASGQSSFGSGFVVGTGQIATNHHVIEGIASGKVKIVGETVEHVIESVLIVDINHDLAVIQATGVTASSLTLGDSDTVEIGQSIYAAGNPQGLTGTFSQGIISGIRPEGNSLVEDTIIQMTAPVSPGSSGGPVLNSDGEVIGVVFSQLTDGQSLNFIIPANFLKTLVSEIESNRLVNIPDPNLHNLIRKGFSKLIGSPIHAFEMESLTWIDGRNSNIINLTGLEFATNLTWISLGSVQVGTVWVNSNSITDISPLAGLTNLDWISLTRTGITDISPLSGLTNLTGLYLGANSITDISALSGLTNLTGLYLWGNSISDISALSGLTNLTDLDLEGNSISDITVLSGLTNLEWLTLEDNSIQDTSPLCTLQDQNPELELDIEILCGPYALFMQDFNNDGNVNLSDLFFLLALIFYSTNDGDINNDGNIDFLDLVSAAESLTESTTSSAPSLAFARTASVATVQAWLDMAHTADDGSLAFHTGIANLKRFLAAMRPEKTELLANYPNPFNPETWISYHLGHAADVTLTIYDTEGAMVRQLHLGHQPVGYYTDKIKAAYWDGRNNLGETVGSGVYFYHLQADDFSATRKLVILK